MSSKPENSSRHDTSHTTDLAKSSHRKFNRSRLGFSAAHTHTHIHTALSFVGLIVSISKSTAKSSEQFTFYFAVRFVRFLDLASVWTILTYSAE